MNEFVDKLKALGQAGRLEIFRILVRAGPDGSCVEEVRRRVRMPGSTLSHHLDTLSRCGLVTARRSGRFIYYAIDWPQTARVIRFLTEDCCAEMYAGLAAAANGATGARAAKQGSRARTGLKRPVSARA
ncbi:MAG: metalloregulator ArsR/SmtB family transcription factor [Candidatus Binataceae bacterium]